MTDTFIYIRGKKVKVEPGEVIFFRPTTYHSGAEYKEDNVRLIFFSFIKN